MKKESSASSVQDQRFEMKNFTDYSWHNEVSTNDMERVDYSMRTVRQRPQFLSFIFTPVIRLILCQSFACLVYWDANNNNCNTCVEFSMS